MENSKYDRLITSLLGDGNESEEFNRIKDVLNTWEKEVKGEVFHIFIYVVECFIYYSEKRTLETFQSIDSQINFRVGENLLMPLRTLERMETSINLFSFLKLSMKFDSNRTMIESTSSLIKDVYEKKLEFVSLADSAIKEEHKPVFVGKLSKNIDKLSDEIKDLHNELQQAEEQKRSIIQKIKDGANILDKNKFNSKLKKIEKVIKNKRKELNNKESNKKARLNEYIQKYAAKIQVQNIMIFDDFLCTGTSILGFLEENLHYIKELTSVRFLFLFLEVTTVGYEKVQSFLECKELKNVTILFGKKSDNIDDKVKEKYDFASFENETERINEKFNLTETKFQINTAIASFINSPNSNYAFLNLNGDGDWKPLFSRERKTPVGINQEALNDVFKNFGGSKK